MGQRSLEDSNNRCIDDDNNHIIIMLFMVGCMSHSYELVVKMSLHRISDFQSQSQQCAHCGRCKGQGPCWRGGDQFMDYVMYVVCYYTIWYGMCMLYVIAQYSPLSSLLKYWKGNTIANDHKCLVLFLVLERQNPRRIS